jgi:CBS domain containing-hemolysin-like protein
MTDVKDDAETGPRPLMGFVRRVLRSLRGLDAGDAAEEVVEALREKEDRGEALEGAQKDMILKAARFDELRVADVMTPRANIVAVEASATLGEVARLLAESQHSRLPIYRETLDDPLGFVHVKEVLSLLAPTPEGASPIKAKANDRILPRIKREVLFVPQSMRLPNLLLKMQAARIHMALVVDEYGGTDGLVTIEDLVEQIVGEISDEHDEDSNLILSRGGSIFEVDGRASVTDLEGLLGQSLVIPDHEEDYDTVAGLAVALIGRVPQRGEVLRHPAGFDLDVLDADPRRIKRLRLRVAGSPSTPPMEPPSGDFPAPTRNGGA